MTKEENQICEIIENKFPDIYNKKGKIPKPFRGRENIKAIVLGADPTFISGKSDFDKVFELEKNEKSRFFKPILKNLNEVKLGLNDIYVQNLVRNHCIYETSKNKYWLGMGTIWIELLKNELDKEFPKNTPAFITAWIILKALTDKGIIKHLSPKMIYSENRFIEPNENLLGRRLIPMFRHWKYSFKRWPIYKNNIKIN